MIGLCSCSCVNKQNPALLSPPLFIRSFASFSKSKVFSNWYFCQACVCGWLGVGVRCTAACVCVRVSQSSCSFP